MSFGDGQASGGIPLPGTSERLGLDSDSLLHLWLRLPAIHRRVTLAGCPAVPASSLTLPAQAQGLRIFHAGVVWNASRHAASVSPTRSFVVQ